MQDCVAALRADANTEAVFSPRVYPQAHIASVVGEDFDDAFVDKDAQLEQFVGGEFEVGSFRWPG